MTLSVGAVELAKKRSPLFGVIPEERYEMIMLWHSLEHSSNPLPTSVRYEISVAAWAPSHRRSERRESRSEGF